MKKIKYLVLSLITIVICASITIPILLGASFSPNSADFTYIILESGMFTQDVALVDGGTHTLNCYRIKNHDNYIAVSWGEDVSSAPAILNIPETITSDKPTGEDDDYTVVAIASAGFAHCPSTKINLPQTVVDIREEAFAYCQSLTTFQIPKDVTLIAPSTFLDCRSLVSLYYSKEDGKKTLKNSKIVSFGDHCFDSCIKLKKMNCPSTLTFFGQSCFQKCSTLSVIRFPVDNGETGSNRNIITVEDYAFADCLSLQRAYFDVNMQNISDYAFADCKSDLTFYFYDAIENFPSSLSAKWRNKKITFGSEIVEGETIDYATLVYDINYDIEKPVEGDYPGLTLATSNAERKLDNARGNTTSVVIVPGGEDYAIITSFETPEEECDPEYYEDGILTIPDEVTINKKTYPVKVIGPGAFSNNDDLREVHFNSQLRQICNKAFWHSNLIETLDFSECDELKEISYSIFNDVVTRAGKEEDATNNDVNVSATLDAANTNTALTSLTLPNSLEYLGNFAFYNFTRLTKGLSFKTVPSQDASLKIIGDYAFAIYSSSSGVTNDSYLPEGTIAEIDVVLPKSLDDAYAPIANIYHSFSWDKKGGSNKTYPTVNASIWNRAAINKNAFENQDGVRTVTMENGGTAHDISFASNVFVRSSNIIRFEASEHLCLIGNEAFKTCSNLKEVFLNADRASDNNHGCDNSGVLNGTDVTDPWGIGDGTNSRNQNIFHTDEYYDIVIYVKRSSNTAKYPNTNGDWYGISQVKDDARGYKTNEIGSGRRENLPVYTVDWTTAGNVKYWHINDAGEGISAHDELLDFANGPKTLDDYNNGYVAFVKGSDNKYTVTRYFTEGYTTGNYAEKIDLTSSKLSGMTISTIGHEAFAGKNIKGRYFILPTTVTKIEERAFYRSNNYQGVRIVTFKNGNTIQTFSGSDKTFDQIITGNKNASENNIIGYCCLSNYVTRVERVAFFNNYFTHVELNTTLSFIGSGAFYSNKDKSRNQSFTFTDYNDETSPDTNSKFEIYNNGIYHKNKKMLLHQANGLNSALTIKSGTKYIGYRSVAGSKYTSVAFDSATERIYGHAFRNCTNLTTITNISNIISISTSDSYQKSDNDYDYLDGKDGTNDASAFEGCSNLKVNFSLMTSLKKIGTASFKGCTNLVTSLGLSKTYTIKSYAAGATPGAGTTTEVASNPDKVLDLSTLTQLTNIEQSAFENAKLNYVIMPNTTDASYDIASKLSCKADMFKGTSVSKVFCGETAPQADQSGTSALSPTSHYPVGCMGGYDKVYYRVHSTSDVLGDSAATTRRYWTAVKTGNANQVEIIIFESKEHALDWLSNAANVSNQCHAFPES